MERTMQGILRGKSFSRIVTVIDNGSIREVTNGFLRTHESAATSSSINTDETIEAVREEPQHPFQIIHVTCRYRRISVENW